jgi:hypothetical protein
MAGVVVRKEASCRRDCVARLGSVWLVLERRRSGLLYGEGNVGRRGRADVFVGAGWPCLGDVLTGVWQLERLKEKWGAVSAAIFTPLEGEPGSAIPTPTALQLQLLLSDFFDGHAELKESYEVKEKQTHHLEE